MARMNVIFDEELLREIRELVPVRQRSEFIEGAVRSRLELLRQESASRAAFGAWSDEGRGAPDLELDQLREGWSERRSRSDLGTDG